MLLSVLLFECTCNAAKSMLRGRETCGRVSKRLVKYEIDFGEVELKVIFLTLQSRQTLLHLTNLRRQLEDYLQPTLFGRFNYWVAFGFIC